MDYTSIFTLTTFYDAIPDFHNWLFEISGLSYETLKGGSSGNDITWHIFGDNVFAQCANKCNENTECVGFTYTKPSTYYNNCYLKSVIQYPPSTSYDASQRTAYMLRK